MFRVFACSVCLVCALYISLSLGLVRSSNANVGVQVLGKLRGGCHCKPFMI